MHISRNSEDQSKYTLHINGVPHVTFDTRMSELHTLQRENVQYCLNAEEFANGYISHVHESRLKFCNKSSLNVPVITYHVL